MRRYFLLAALSFSSFIYAQTVVRMEEDRGVFTMPCKVNGLQLSFIFDTGASTICISVTEALFMLKHGYLSEEDILDTEYFMDASGDIEEGTKIILREVEIGGLLLNDVEATIIYSIDAPLLFGQTALSQLGDFEFNYREQTLTIRHSLPSRFIRDEEVIFITKFDSPAGEVPLLAEPEVQSQIIYNCPGDAMIQVIEHAGGYFRVKVNGYTGYLSKNLLVRKW